MSPGSYETIMEGGNPDIQPGLTRRAWPPSPPPGASSRQDSEAPLSDLGGGGWQGFDRSTLGSPKSKKNEKAIKNQKKIK